MRYNAVKVILYTVLKLIFGILTKILFSTKVAGRENLPPEGPFIIAANHSSFADVAVIAVNMPLMIRWIARQDVYNIWYMKPFHKVLGSIVKNGSVEKALGALAQGDVVGIFPEGGRSADGRLRKADPGVAILALKSGVPVVPIGISGAFKAYGPHMRFPKFHPISVKIGKPMIFTKSDKDIIEESVLRGTTDRIMAEIGALLV